MTESEEPIGWTSQLPLLEDVTPSDPRSTSQAPDRRDGSVYVPTNDLRLAVDVALATRRPLLLRGDPGSGKSSLAAYLARNLGWRYYEHVVTSRTRPRDLLWTFDAVRKLADASAGRTGKSIRDHDYVEPGVIWWALDPDSAARRGAPPEEPPATLAVDPLHGANAGRDPRRSVVLIDEIDKADPDLPNGLLVPLGSSEFLVEETGVLVTEKAPSEVPDGPASAMLVLITTNEERDLPRAFLRRCVTTELKQPGKKRLVEIGRRHLTAQSVDCDADTVSLLESVADKIIELRKAGRGRSQRPPSTAEYLDAVFACRALDVRVAKTGVWPTLERLILVKGAESTDGA